jgi:RNA polymerase sigma-70 factor (ECF subfamily)
LESATASEARFRRVFNEHYEAISRYVHRRLPAADANDAAAEVFAVAWRKIGNMPEGDEALPWLYGVARNEVRTSLRSTRRFLNLKTKLAGQAQHPEPGPEVVIVRNSEQAELLAALQMLTVGDQEILRLRAYEQLTHPEIAVVLGCSVEAAKKRSARAMKRLRKAAALPDPQDAATGSRVIPEGGDG